jgi:hypothetical protein
MCATLKRTDVVQNSLQFIVKRGSINEKCWLALQWMCDYSNLADVVQNVMFRQPSYNPLSESSVL